MIKKFCISQPPPTSKNARWPGESEPVIVVTESGRQLVAYHKIWSDEPGDSEWYAVTGPAKPLETTGPDAIKYWFYMPEVKTLG